MQDQVAKLQTLLSTKHRINDALNNNSEHLQFLKHSKKVSLEDLLNVAAVVQYTNHAPNEWKIGMPLVRGHPPAPQPEEMRCGCLENYHTVIAKVSEQTKLLIPTVEENTQFDVAALQVEMRAKKRTNQDISKDNSIIITKNPEADTLNQPAQQNVAVADESECTLVSKVRKINNRLSFGLSESEESDSSDEGD